MRSFDSSKTNLSLPEWARLYVLYMSVGVSAIPIGVIYGVLVVKGFGQWWVALISTALGLWVARVTWKYVDSMFVVQPLLTVQMGGIRIMLGDQLAGTPVSSSELALDSLVVALYKSGGPSSSYPRYTEGQSQLADEYAYAPHG